MSFAHSSFGPVAIIPASAIRENQNLLSGQQHHRRQQQSRRRATRANTAADFSAFGNSAADEVPINLAYYLQPAGATAAATMYQPSSYFTTPRAPPLSSSYYTPRTPPRTPPRIRQQQPYRTRSYTAPSSDYFSDRRTFAGGAGGRQYQANNVGLGGGGFGNLPTSTDYSRRAQQQQQQSIAQYHPRYSRSRSDVMAGQPPVSVVGGGAPSIIFTDRDFHSYHIGDVKSFSGPIKYPEPLYKKHRYSRTRSDVLGAQGMVGGAPSSIFAGTPPPQRRRYIYPASYTTYPPSTTFSKRLDTSYNIFVRVALKIAQLICGAIVIGCISGPTHGVAFHTFVLETKSDGQLYVMVVACLCLIVTFLFLITIWFSNRSQGWRNGDGFFSAFAAFAYLVAGCVESWYAACYPPYGIMFPQACRVGAWVAASVFAFINMVLYTVDFVLAAQTGIDIL